MKTLCWTTTLLLALAATAHAAPLIIQNETLTVAYDQAAATFTAAERASGKTFLREGKLERRPAEAKVEPIQDPIFGQGTRIAVSRADGCTGSLELYNKLPLLLVRSTRHNGNKTMLDVDQIVPATFTLDLDKPAGQLRTMGTGGLLPPGKNPGSYMFLACADPATRRGVVAGWLSCDRGSGVIFSSVAGDKVHIKARIDYGHLRIPAGKSAELETLAVGCFDDARQGLEQYADAMALHYKITLRPRTGVYCTWYTDGHGGAGDERSTVELARFAAKHLKPFGLTVVQIDDKWQDGPQLDGPTRGFERCRPGGPYPHGMQPVAKQLDKLGMTFGLWWLPFGRNHAAPDYKDRQHWFARWADGKLMRTSQFGGTCLDLTHPEVKAHLAYLARLFRTWGVKYYKMDGLWTGADVELAYINDGYKEDHFTNCAPLHDPLKTNIEAYRDGLKLLRDNAGPDVFFSGCCISQNMRSICAIGLVDSMRVGPDFNHDGEELRTGPIRGSRLYFMNGRLWWNDPDPTVVRARSMAGADKALSHGVTLEQARLTTSWVALTGQFYLSSDWLPALPAERLETMKRTIESHNATARPVDYFDRPLPMVWLVTDAKSGPRRDVVGLFNFYKKPLEIDYRLAKLGLDPAKTYHAFDFWANRPMADVRGSLKDRVAPGSCRVIALRAVEGHPLVLSTSRHVTQGIVDMTGETWHQNTLSGTSRVVAGDPYELRIAGLSDGGRQWTSRAAAVSAADKAAGVTMVCRQSDGLLRATIRSPQTRVVQWTIKFEEASAASQAPIPDGKPHAFSFGGPGNSQFLLDGKPFQMLGGEMHPARIPPEYWRHRIRMAKALGLNTIAIYVFWNAHEQTEGKYDFTTGPRNIGEFLRIAREEGMWINLRPGPYCCGEWDLGGIPTYLLRYGDIKLRTLADPRYVKSLENYLRELAKVVRPHMAENGGPILITQLENEYGSYPRRDHDYMVWLRDQWVRNGVKGPFYTADGAGENYLQGITVAGAAVGLDTGTNEAHFALARRINPGVPVFSSEVYPGWLRHWGEGNWRPNNITGLVKFYMDTNKSFNLYMVHGGTNFGFTAGANNGGPGQYEPDVTSYDYASPINEQGRPTPEYHELAAYVAAGRTLPEIPGPIPAMRLPRVAMEPWSSVWDRLPTAVSAAEPAYFESLGQNQGMMLYRTRIPAGGKRKLTFANLHDYGQVFVDGALVGTLDRRRGQRALDLPACKAPAVLEVLVEAMGHINFTIAMDSDRKGIYGAVKLGRQPLRGWEMQRLPLDEAWFAGLRQAANPSGRPGGIFRGRFTLDTVADTFLDMSHYKKGVVWVNGHNLGRYWSIGPQQRLYCPAPWLTRGENTLVVLDLEQSAALPVEGQPERN